MSQTKGQSSIQFAEAPYIIESSSIVGQKEGEGPLGKLFDSVEQDPMLQKKTWEEAESELQRKAVQKAIDKSNLTQQDLRYLFAGDLLGQSIASSFGLMQFQIPLFGLYGACSTAGESLCVAAMTVAAGYADNAVAVTSSHFASAEKQFRYPLEYANQRPLSANWTVTGSGAFILGTKRSKARITGITPGKIVDYGIKDSFNMGAAMAPAACDTIYQNFMDFNRSDKDYDKIITGDLGLIGSKILIDLLKEKGFDISQIHMDCGVEIYDGDNQDTHAGGSGCGCSAVTLSAYILPKIHKGEWKKILFLPTGALLSTVSFNEGQSVPGIAHGVVIEHC
ncbi:stage V sporulation protein AD [Anaerosacchariphilus polymeriproducens]|uniref:Stage V sporulation protein AD n=1 Tax=Anaerosacchariphilus polymeriproducens TaxID=1812858 RepID=A0A371AV11_9FIRM|nr:stage V sporulation protein AD [Anaerosacchariphilus polymeriproducens]RDU23379.1 stage V sporulation protein AD [Anaerosacchariphilus polymeriproducens]